MEVKQSIIGHRKPRLRATLTLLVLLLGATTVFLTGLEINAPLGGLVLGILLLAASLLISGYTGWSRGGAVTGSGAVFLTLLWIAFFPPLIGYLRGEKWAGSRYSTFRLTDVMLTPRGEIDTAIQLLPLYLLLSIILGGGVFLLGFSARRIYDKRDN